MITFKTSSGGEVDINPNFISAVHQPNAGSVGVTPRTFIVMSSGYELSYSIDMSIEEVRKKLAQEIDHIAWLSDCIETLTNVIRNR